MISKSWEEHKEIKRVMIFLQSYQITTGYAVKIYKTYGNKAIEKLKENPYRLVDDVFGIGFKIADRIAQNLGVEANSPARVKAGIKYILNELANQGNCYGVVTEIIKYGCELLEVEESLIEKTLSILRNNQEVIVQEDRVWLPLYYFAELGVAKKLIELLKFPQQLINIDVQKKIKYLEKSTIYLLLKSKKMPLIKSF
jgi:ATP-dependent exoDNAse (exonuclease V), alpha subunit - helicase superfamily I member